MREFLQDVHAHMDDGFGRAQVHTKTPLRKRFYKVVTVAPCDEGYCIHLDGRPTKTPGHKPVAVPDKELAHLLAAEWEAQREDIDPGTMPLVRLMNSAVEGGHEVAEDLREEVIKFAGNDLLLFRAQSPRELVALQGEIWDGALAKVERHFDVRFEPVTGIVHKNQPEATLVPLKKDLADIHFIALTALVSITGLTGSGILAIALRRGLIEPEAVWDIAHLDETYNAKNWGEDGEAVARLQKRRVEFDAAVVVLRMLDKS